MAVGHPSPLDGLIVLYHKFAILYIGIELPPDHLILLGLPERQKGLLDKKRTGAKSKQFPRPPLLASKANRQAALWR